MPHEVFVLALFGMIFSAGLIGGVFMLVHQWLRRRDAAALPAGGAAVSALTQQVAQLQQSLDAVAVEVERISEGQRFVTKLMAERGDSPKLPPVQH